MQAGVEVVEQPGAGHVELGAFGFLGGAAVHAQRARDALRSSTCLAAIAAPTRPAPSRLWPQPWPLVLPSARAPAGHGRVAEAGQCVVLGQKPDDRPARPWRHSATKAVGTPAVPRLVMVKPAASSSRRCTLEDRPPPG